MSVELLTVEPSREEIILRAVKATLTKVIRDTAVEPGMLHPLAASTRDEIRQCFILITERERELATNSGRPMAARPHFKDEPRPMGDIVVPISSIKRPPHDHEG